MTNEFGDLLRSERLRSGLSQEALADRSRVSAAAISSYERGIRFSPRYSTVALLAEALQLDEDARARFEAAADPKHDYIRASTGAARNNLPWLGTSFIGRQREVAEVSTLLAVHRLVTLTGTGGIGKTRTALEVASHLPLAPSGGVWLIDLSPIVDGSLIVNKVASALDIALPGEGDFLAPLVSALKMREVLLILDNCEHVLTEVRALTNAILHACSRAKVLTTSRERLGIPGERAYRLATLSVPGKTVAHAEARSYDALVLFGERAAAAKHDFTFSDESVAVAADICRRLDGIALAIELAAARLPSLSLAEMRARLNTHFHLIATHHNDGPSRQKTLHSTIAWSYDLLTEPERVLFRRLAIFENGWTLEAAEAVCGEPNGSLGRHAVLDTLLSLVEKSLVNANLEAPTPRYSLFESTRAFALEQLSDKAEISNMSLAHARWMSTYADRVNASFGVVPRRQWETAIGVEWDNFLAAVEWALGRVANVVLAGRIVCGIDKFWRTGGLNALGLRYVNAILDQFDTQHLEHEHPVLTARLLLTQSPLLFAGEIRPKRLRRAIALLEPTGEKRTLARCFTCLSIVFTQMAEYSDAETASDRALAIMREAHLEDSLLYAAFLGDRSNIFLWQGQLDRGKSTIEEALSLAESHNDDWLASYFRTILAGAEFADDNVSRAVTLGEEALENARESQSGYQPSLLANLACYYLVLGNTEAARAYAREAIDLLRSANEEARSICAALQHLAAVAALGGHKAAGSRLLGYIDARLQREGYRRDRIDQRSHDLLLGSLREELSDEEISSLAAQGADLSDNAAIAEALSI